jgi:3-phytase
MSLFTVYLACNSATKNDAAPVSDGSPSGSRQTDPNDGGAADMSRGGAGGSGGQGEQGGTRGSAGGTARGVNTSVDTSAGGRVGSGGATSDSRTDNGGASGGNGTSGALGTAGSVGNGGRSSGGALGHGGQTGSGGRTGAGGSTGADTSGTGGVGTAGAPQIPATPLPTVETESLPTGSTTDIADDSAIYANPTSPELSVVIADDKDETGGGIAVFNMQGKLLQFRQDGMIGNVDLRADFPFGGQSIVLVGANNRTNDTLTFWQLDPAKQALSAPIGNGTKTISPNYGFCLYHSALSGKFYAFVTQETGSSTMEQYELAESGGKVTATKVRSFEVGSITEGCVADDDLGRLYVAQEDVALWRYDAEPSGGSTRVKVAAVGDGIAVADLEGVALAKGPGETGYLVLSLQSSSKFAVYDRESNAYLRTFAVGASGAIDATSETDGLDIATADLGPGFPKGALVVHDGSNTGGTTSNLKFIPLQ